MSLFTFLFFKRENLYISILKFWQFVKFIYNFEVNWYQKRSYNMDWKAFLTLICGISGICLVVYFHQKKQSKKAVQNEQYIPTNEEMKFLRESSKNYPEILKNVLKNLNIDQDAHIETSSSYNHGKVLLIISVQIKGSGIATVLHCYEEGPVEIIYKKERTVLDDFCKPLLQNAFQKLSIA